NPVQENDQRMREQRQYEYNLRRYQQQIAAVAECLRQREREEEQERQRQREREEEQELQRQRKREEDQELQRQRERQEEQERQRQRHRQQAKLQAAQRLRNEILDAHYPPLGHHHKQAKGQNQNQQQQRLQLKPRSHNYHVGGTWYDDNDKGDDDWTTDPDWGSGTRWENGFRATQEEEGYTGSDGYFHLPNHQNHQIQCPPHYHQEDRRQANKTSSAFVPRQKKGRKGRGDLFQDDYHAGFSKPEIQAMSSERKAEYETRKLKSQLHETIVASH
ncbi:hypothetical protein BGX24_002276, partial [Mortierella sp. AD032]